MAGQPPGRTMRPLRTELLPIASEYKTKEANDE
jgi:hypothetical protein